MSKFRKVKKLLLTKIFVYIKYFYGLILNLNLFFFVSKNFHFFCGKAFRIFFLFHIMKQNETKKDPKSSKNFHCEFCDFNSSKKSLLDRHLTTGKHKNETNETNETKKDPHVFQCACGIHFNSRTTLWRHKKNCNYEKPKESNEKSINIDKELIMMLIKQNAELLEIVKNGTNITNNTNTNCMNNNKTFNLQFFLNETCKNAMNITDFVDSIKLQLTDLERMGELGYAEGLSSIITTNLKALDVSLRPVHCADKKRETIYIKDDNQWAKEDDNKTKLRKAIKNIANNNIKLLPQYREKNPKCSDSSSRLSDKYDKMVIEIMGGIGNDDYEKENKIIHNISKCTTIEKYQNI